MPSSDGIGQVTIRPHVRIPMSDGVELDADLYLPSPDALSTDRRWPIVIWYDPYRKDDSPRSIRRTEMGLARQGIVAVDIDVRGTGSSGGTALDEYSPQEQADGVEAIAWLASQPWSNGNVGMMGASYSGFNSLQVAALRPPALKAIAPMYFTDDRYTDDCHYKGGAMQMLFDISAYGLAMTPRNALPPEPDALGEAWADTWEAHLKAEPWLLRWIEHQIRDDYWRNGSINVDYGAIECATFLIGGWRDGYTNTNLRTFDRLTCPKKVLIGPWLHSLPDNGTPGPRIDHLHEIVRFFDHWLNGADNGVMDEPPITIFVQRYDPPTAQRDMTSGSWRHEASWPLPRSSERRLALGPDGRLEDVRDADPAGEPSDSVSYRYEPTAGTSFGLFSASTPYILPMDQRAEDAVSLNWTSEPLEDELEILGRPRADLHLSVTTTVATVVVRLMDVAPDGTAALVTKGVLNLTHRDSHEYPSPVEPGEPYDISIELDATSWVFEPGHRLRIGINGSDYPNAWPSPYLHDGTIFTGTGQSSLALPVVSPQDPGLPIPDLRPGAAMSSAAGGDPPVWRVTRDHLTSRTEVLVRSSGTTRVSDDLTVRAWREGLTSVASHDPAHATARGRSDVALIRPNQTITASARGEIRSDETSFHVTVQLDVTIDDRPFHSKSWVRTFKRELL